MRVKMHTEKTFELILTDNESKLLRQVSKKAGCEPTSLLENLIDSSLAHAADTVEGNSPWDDGD